MITSMHSPMSSPAILLKHKPQDKTIQNTLVCGQTLVTFKESSLGLLRSRKHPNIMPLSMVGDGDKLLCRLIIANRNKIECISRKLI